MSVGLVTQALRPRRWQLELDRRILIRMLAETPCVDVRLVPVAHEEQDGRADFHNARGLFSARYLTPSDSSGMHLGFEACVIGAVFEFDALSR